MKNITAKLVGLSVATVASVAFAADAARALTFSGHECDISNLTVSVACEGAYEGNDSNTIDAGTTVFGATGWSEILKAESEESGTWTEGGLTVNGGGTTSGTWSLTGFDYSLYDQVMFVLKGGTTFSAYLMDGATSGDWDTSGLINKSGNTPALSHFAIYTRGAGTPPEGVPEPGMAIGLSAVAFGLLRKRMQDNA